METVEQVKMRMERMLKPDRLAHSTVLPRRLGGWQAGTARIRSRHIMRAFVMIFAKYAVGRTVAMDKKVCYNSG